jgi:hypothetical protein
MRARARRTAVLQGVVPVRLRFLALLAPLAAIAPVLSACDDNTFLQDAVVRADTVDLGLPGGDRGSAIDLVRASANATLIRRPETVQDAEQWDFAVRRAAGGLVLHPNEGLGTGGRGAGIGATTRPFDDIDEAPRGTSSYSENDVALSANAVYLLRSRTYGAGLGINCLKYGKARVVSLDAATGQVRLALVINENCDDERLTDD